MGYSCDDGVLLEYLEQPLEVGMTLVDSTCPHGDGRGTR